MQTSHTRTGNHASRQPNNAGPDFPSNSQADFSTRPQNRPHMVYSRPSFEWPLSPASPAVAPRRPRRNIAAAVAIVAVLAIAVALLARFALLGGRGGSAPSEEIRSLDAQDALQSASDAPNASEVAKTAQSTLDATSGVYELSMFDAATDEVTLLSDDNAGVQSVVDAVNAFADKGYDVGFVVYDVQSQKGLDYNADEAFFSASTIKAPFSTALCQAIDEQSTADISFDDMLFEDTIVAGTGIMATDDQDEYPVSEVVENSIVHSDNTGYALLREHCNNDNLFENWCAVQGVNAVDWEGLWYPNYTPRDLAKLWLGVGTYLLSDNEHASWLKGLLQNTDLSFLRDGISDAETIWAKPGFEWDQWGTGMDSMNEGGTVVDSNGAYIVAIMSTAPFDDELLTENQELIENLAGALAQARGALLLVS